MLTVIVILLKSMLGETWRYTTSMRRKYFFHKANYKLYYLEINCDDSKWKANKIYIFYVFGMCFRYKKIPKVAFCFTQ